MHLTSVIVLNLLIFCLQGTQDEVIDVSHGKKLHGMCKNASGKQNIFIAQI